MKRILIVPMLLAVAGMSAQKVKNPGDFDEIKVFDRISVTLFPSEENKVEISGSKSGDVEVVNNNGQLKIRMSVGRLLDGETVMAKVYFKTLKSIDASEGSEIETGEILKQSSIIVTAKEGAQISLGLEVGSVDAKAVTGGVVALSGKADSLDAKLGTGGILKAKDLVTINTEVDINAGGEASVNATELVDADVKAGGNVTIYGHPKKIEKKITLGGSIEESKH
jgi:hypothetical protein